MCYKIPMSWPLVKGRGHRAPTIPPILSILSRFFPLRSLRLCGEMLYSKIPFSTHLHSIFIPFARSSVMMLLTAQTCALRMICRVVALPRRNTARVRCNRFEVFSFALCILKSFHRRGAEDAEIIRDLIAALISIFIFVIGFMMYFHTNNSF